MSNEAFPGTSIDNPPDALPEYESNIGRAVGLLRKGKRVPYDLAQDLREDGIDVPALTATQSRFAD